ncbi:MAG: hypothetical protein AAGA54_37560 [Myxococcota bacterium]
MSRVLALALALLSGCGLAAHRNNCAGEPTEVRVGQVVTPEDAEEFARALSLDDPAELTCEQVCRRAYPRDGVGSVERGDVGACSYTAPDVAADGSVVDGMIDCEALVSPICGD